MRTETIKVKLRDGEMGAYLAIPDKTPVGAVIFAFALSAFYLPGAARFDRS